jgi:4'-phosphopantetheinyl transferase
VAALRALPLSQQRARFFDFWTLKEAYIKARGLGLSLPLERFWFTVSAGAIGIDIDPSLGDHPARWRFTLRAPSPRHVIATAVEAPGEIVEGPALLPG